MINPINKYVKTIKEDSISSFIKSLKFQVRGFGRFNQQKINQINAFFVNDYELIYYVKGTVIISTENTELIAKPGHLILLKPYQLYNAKTIGDEQVYYYYIHFKIIPDTVNSILYTLINNSGSIAYLNKSDFPDISCLFSSVLNNWRNYNHGVYIIVESILKILIAYLFINNISDKNEMICTSVDQESSILLNAIQYIDSHISDNIKLTELAKEIGISTSGLYKIFTNYMNLSPSEYIQKARLYNAKRLLSISGSKIDDVVQQCGFSSVSHLSRNFTEEYGFTPSQYQKSIQDKEVWNDTNSLPPKL